MQTTLVIRAGWLSLCVLVSAIVSSAQGVTRSAPIDPTEVTQQPTVQVVYTGRLFDYFRVPSKQSGVAKFQPCQKSGKEDSQAAIDFLRNRQRYEKAILVGTGDNFAPRREGRFFDPPPPKPDQSNTNFQPRNKEPYEWNKGTWVRPEEIEDDKERDALERQVHHGEATIPTVLPG